MYSATLAGTGIALLPCQLAENDPRLVQVPHTNAPEPRTIWQVVHKDLQDSARIRAVLDLRGEILSEQQSGQAAA